MNQLDGEFQILFTIYGYDCLLGHVTMNKLRLRLYMQFDFGQPSGFNKDFNTTESKRARTKVS